MKTLIKKKTCFKKWKFYALFMKIKKKENLKKAFFDFENRRKKIITSTLPLHFQTQPFSTDFIYIKKQFSFIFSKSFKNNKTQKNEIKYKIF